MAPPTLRIPSKRIAQVVFAVALVTRDVHGALCDMTKLAPILSGDDMNQCTTESQFVVPNIGPYSRGYTEVPDAVCTSAACGAAIGAIQQLGLDECELSRQVGGGAAVEASLYAQHLDKVFDLCGDDPSTYGDPAPTPDPDAMDEDKVCTQASVASHFWETRSDLEQCVGVSLRSLVSPEAGGTNAVDVIEAFTVCPSCATIQEALNASEMNASVPVCQLPGRGISFRNHLERALSFCAALRDLANGKPPTDSVLSATVLNESAMCDFNSRSFSMFLLPVQNELLSSEACSALLFSPSQALTADDKASICETCPAALGAISKITVPTCRTSFGVSYSAFLDGALGDCALNNSSASQDAGSNITTTTLEPTSAPPSTLSSAHRTCVGTSRWIGGVVAIITLAVMQP